MMENTTIRRYERKIHDLRRINYHIEEDIEKAEARLKTWLPAFALSIVLMLASILI